MRASSSRWLGTRSSSWSPAITHEQCSRIADTAVADVDCRPRDQFNHIALTLVAEGAGQVVDPRSGSRWDNRYVLGTKHGPCQSLDQRVSMFASGHTTEQFGEQLGVFEDHLKGVGGGFSWHGRLDTYLLREDVEA